MERVIFFWNDLNNYKNKNLNITQIAFKKDKNTTKVEWDKYHVINSQKWLMNDLLSEINFDITENITNSKNNKIILVATDIKKNFSFYENICSNNKVFLIHIGDEFLTNLDFSIKIYQKSYYVFRPYYFYSKLKNVMYIPVGYKSSNNFYKEEKKYFWSFFGTIYKSSRHDMIDVFIKNFDDYFLHITKFFGDPKGLDADEMYKQISRSRFSLCPTGFYHPETYRVFEVLENNSIPVIQNPYSFYEKILPNNNFIKINLWSDFLKIVKNINYEKLLNLNVNWYLNYKKDLKLKIKKIIYG